MTPRFLLVPLVLISASTFAAEEPAPSTSAHDILKARIAEEAKAAPQKGPAGATTPASSQPAAAKPAAAAPADANPILKKAPETVDTAADSAAVQKPASKDVRSEPATVMPKVEVRKNRITEIDQQLAKQEQDIEREKKNLKVTEADKALNDESIAKPLSIFGGESSQFRQRVASERVSLMEDEKDLLEAMAHAKTKQEKAELKKQLDVLRAQRRELERTLR